MHTALHLKLHAHAPCRGRALNKEQPRTPHLGDPHAAAGARLGGRLRTKGGPKPTHAASDARFARPQPPTTPRAAPPRRHGPDPSRRAPRSPDGTPRQPPHLHQLHEELHLVPHLHQRLALELVDLVQLPARPLHGADRAAVARGLTPLRQQLKPRLGAEARAAAHNQPRRPGKAGQGRRSSTGYALLELQAWWERAS
jgi:hypothetical protein